MISRQVLFLSAWCNKLAALRRIEWIVHPVMVHNVHFLGNLFVLG